MEESTTEERMEKQWLYEVTKSGSSFSASLKCSAWHSCPAVLRCWEGRDELHLETCNSLFNSAPIFTSLGQISGNKTPFASLRFQPQCFLTQMQLRAVPLAVTASASLETSNRWESPMKEVQYFCPRMFHLIIF